MRHVSGPAAALILALLCGCGNITAPDLFVIDRTGAIPGARLSVRITDDGFAHCNALPRRQLPDPLLLDAREIKRDLADDARRHLLLAPGPNAVLTYRLRDQDGTVTFSDTSPGRTAKLLRVEGFTRVVARQVCRLPR